MTEEADEMSAIARSFLLGEGYSSEKMLALPPYKRQSILPVNLIRKTLRTIAGLATVISNDVEGSRQVTLKLSHRDPSTSLGMTRFKSTARPPVTVPAIFR